MENVYLSALHGMENLLDPMAAYLEKFHRKSYENAFVEYYEAQLPVYQALEQGYQSAIDKEQYLQNMADAVTEKGAQLAAAEKKRAARLTKQMDLNLMMVVYILPSLKKFQGEVTEPLIEKILAGWKERFPDSNLSVAAMEDIESGFHRKWCYITTAVCETLGKPDDCYELTLLRNYRDTWLMSSENGEEMIREYYDVAPTIVKRIGRRPDKKEIYRSLWDQWICPCIRLIEEGRNEECRDLYRRMVEELENEWLFTAGKKMGRTA